MRSCLLNVPSEGKFEELEGVKVYVATPSQNYPKDKVLLFLTDIYGVGLQNALVRTLNSYVLKVAKRFSSF
jgi:hypothetical protein